MAAGMRIEDLMERERKKEREGEKEEEALIGEESH